MPNDRHARTRCRWNVAAAVACLSATLCVGVARPQEPAPDPALLERLGILTIVTGLDARNNPIDALLSKFGTACSTEPPWDTRPCPIEKKLMALLRELPADRDAIADKLGTFGAICHKQPARLDCVYERHVHYTGWIAGHDGPAGISDDVFQITFTVTSYGELMDYSVEFRRNIGIEP